jgi:Bacterial Ig-like domain (group 3)
MEVSVDYLGDVLSPRSKIDLTSVDKVVVGSEPVFQIKGSLESSDFGSGVANIYYRFNQQGFKPYNSTLAMVGLKEGDNVLEFKAKDNVNNKEQNQTYEFFLDKSAPVVTSDVVGDQYQSRGRVYVSERTKIKLTAEDNKAGVEEITYAINGGTIRLYREPFPLPKGTVIQTVEYHAKDKVKNSSFGSVDMKMLNKRALNMDVVPPTLSNGYLGRKHTTRDTIFINKNSKIVLKASDGLSGVKAIGYKINGGFGFEYKKPFSIEEEGFYEVDYFGTDMVNNRNTDKFYFEVDNTAPRITYVLSSDPIGSMKFKKYEALLDVYPKGINLFLAAADNRIDVAKIYYAINGGRETEYVTPINLNKQGIVTFKIRALDFLGNENSEEHVIYVDSK